MPGGQVHYSWPEQDQQLSKAKTVSKSQAHCEYQAEGKFKEDFPKCKVVIGPGLSHYPCTFIAGKRTVIELIGKENVSGQEQILSEAVINVVY